MKEKELRIVVAFETTTAAMQFESHAKCLGIQGRIRNLSMNKRTSLPIIGYN